MDMFNDFWNIFGYLSCSSENFWKLRRPNVHYDMLYFTFIPLMGNVFAFPIDLLIIP